MFRVISQIVQWDAALALKSGSEAWHGLVFFVMAVTLFPLAVGTDPKVLQPIAPAVLWVLAILSSLMSLPALYQRDHEDGTLEQLRLLPVMPEFIVLAKCIAHWLVSALPLLIIAPFLALMLFMPQDQIGDFVCALLLGTLSITAIGSISAALLLNVSRSQMLLSIITLPLYLPVLMWGVQASLPTGSDTAWHVLWALALLGVPLGIWLSALLLKNSSSV